MPLIRRRLREYWIAYVVPFLVADPTQEELDGLVMVTEQFWDDYFRDLYAGSDTEYYGIEIDVEQTLFGAGIPDERYNYLIDFNTTVLFNIDTVAPTVNEIFTTMANANFQSYILDYVRTQPAFISTNRVEFSATEVILPGEVPA